MPRDEKLRLLEAGLKANVSPLALNLVRLLEQRGKSTLAREIQIAFQELLDEQRGVAHAVVTTAVPLADDERAAIAERLRRSRASRSMSRRSSTRRSSAASSPASATS